MCQNKPSLYRVIREERSVSGDVTISAIMKEKFHMNNNCDITVHHYGMCVWGVTAVIVRASKDPPLFTFVSAVKVKVKVILQQAEVAQGVPGRLRHQIS